MKFKIVAVINGKSITIGYARNAKEAHELANTVSVGSKPV
jgi:hypothetical protein